MRLHVYCLRSGFLVMDWFDLDVNHFTRTVFTPTPSFSRIRDVFPGEKGKKRLISGFFTRIIQSTTKKKKCDKLQLNAKTRMCLLLWSDKKWLSANNFLWGGGGGQTAS